MSTLTPAMLRLLKKMAINSPAEDDGDNEVICEGGICYIGTRRIQRATVDGLLRLCLIAQFDYGAGAEYFCINQTGRSVLRRPELTEELRSALIRGKPFTINNSDSIEWLTSDSQGPT